MRRKGGIIIPVPLPEGSLTHLGTWRWDWKVGNYEFCPWQPSAAGRKRIGGISVLISTIQSLRVMKRRPPQKFPAGMARGLRLRALSTPPTYLHKRRMFRPILQQPNDSLWETLKHRLTKLCFWDVGVLVEVVGSIWLYYQVWRRFPKESIMGEGAGQKLAAQELVSQFNACEVNVIVKSVDSVISSVS